MPFPIGGPLSVRVNAFSKSSRYRDIALNVHWGHKCDFSRSRGVIGHVTI